MSGVFEVSWKSGLPGSSFPWNVLYTSPYAITLPGGGGIINWTGGSYPPGSSNISFRVVVTSSTGITTSRKIQCFNGSVSTVGNFSVFSGTATATTYSSGVQYVPYIFIT
jgi:hypothetical protein